MKRYWVHTPDEGLMGRFETLQEAIDELEDIIQDGRSNDEGWHIDEEMKDFCILEVTHVATQKNLKIRPPKEELDEDGCGKDGEDWTHEFDEICDYKVEAI